MTMHLYLEGKRITQKAAKELVGEERFKQMKKEAKEAFMNDPCECIEWFTGKGRLMFEFC